MPAKNTKFIFNKYAFAYEEKYMNMALYSDSLDVFLGRLQKNAGILDVGCGPGNIVSYLLEKQPDLKITGIDISPNMVELARKNNPKALFYCKDGRDIQAPDQQFDAVIAGFYLPYLSREEALKFIYDVSGILGEHGLLYISFMEGNYENSGFVGSSQNSEEKLFTYYHERGYLLEALKNYDFSLIDLKEIENPHNKEGVKDLVIISSK